MPVAVSPNAILLPGAVLPQDLAYGALIEALGPDVGAHAKDLEVYATDESPSAQAAGALLSRWPIFDGLPIRVVSVADVARPWTTGIAPTMYGQVLDAYAADLRGAKKEHQRIAEDAATRLQESGREATAEMHAGDAAGEIIAVAEERGADLVVLGSRGRTGLTRLLLGSVARNVLSGSTASVLIVRDETEDSVELGAAPN